MDHLQFGVGIYASSTSLSATLKYMSVSHGIRSARALIAPRAASGSPSNSVLADQQAYHWGALYPDFVKRICSICGSAKTAPHNWLYLNAYKESVEGWNNGSCETWPAKLLDVMASIATTMAWSQDWYRQGNYREAGADTLEEFLAGAPGFFEAWVPAPLIEKPMASSTPVMLNSSISS